MGDIVSWPWPRFIQTDYHTYHVGLLTNDNLVLSQAVWTSSNYWAITPVLNLGSSINIQSVTIADFDDFSVVSTFGYDSLLQPIRQMFVRDFTEPVIFGVSGFIQAADIVLGNVLNNNGQLIGANASVISGTTWDNLNSKSIIWSGIGDYSFDPLVNKTAGTIQGLIGDHSKQHPNIYRLMRLGELVLAYGDSGIVVLAPIFAENIFTYGTKRLPGYGIISGNHVAGDNSLQGFIDSRGDFWTIDASLKLTRRGYQEYILELLTYTHSNNDYRTIVSYLPDKRRFYISNGNKCLVINEFGAYHTFQSVSSIVQISQGNYATTLDAADVSAYITTDKIDYNSRGFKSVEALLSSIRVPIATTAVFNAVDWRLAQGATMTRSPLYRADPGGQSGIHVTAIDFRLHTEISTYVDAEFYDFQANVKFSDARYKRGTSPGQYNTQG
jgi:hypothetical protein